MTIDPSTGSSRPTLIALLSMLLIVLVQPAAAWSPPPPPADEFDWVQLTSDEWLKGEVISLYEDVLEFDSDNLGILKLDWEDVRQLFSSRPQNISLGNGGEVHGRVRVNGDELVVTTSEGDRTLERSAAVAIVPYSGDGKGLWKAKISLGINLRSGNNDQKDFNLQASIKRLNARNRLLIDYLGSLTRTDGVDTTNSHRLSGQYDIFSSNERFWRPFFGEYFRDPFQNVADRITVGAGVGYHMIDTSRTSWDLFAGPGYQYTRFDSVERGENADESSFALILSTDYETEVTGSVDFIAGYRIQLTNRDTGGYSHHAIATLETELTRNLDLDVSLIWDRIQYPTATADGVIPEQDDYKLIFGLGFDI